MQSARSGVVAVALVAFTSLSSIACAPSSDPDETMPETEVGITEDAWSAGCSAGLGPINNALKGSGLDRYLNAEIIGIAGMSEGRGYAEVLIGVTATAFPVAVKGIEAVAGPLSSAWVSAVVNQ